jgi:hypothetical protein
MGHGMQSIRLSGELIFGYVATAVVSVCTLAFVLSHSEMLAFVLVAITAVLGVMAWYHLYRSSGYDSLSPSALFVWVLLAYFVLGLAAYALRETSVGNYPADMSTVCIVGLVSIAALLAGNMLARTIRESARTRRLSHPPRGWNAARLDRVVWILIGFSWLGALLLFFATGNVPIMSLLHPGGVDASRDLVGGAGWKHALLWCGINAFVLAVVEHRIPQPGRRHRHLRVSIQLVASLAPLTLYGGRFMIGIPLLLALLWLARAGRRASFLQLAPWLVVLLVLATLFGAVRSSGLTGTSESYLAKLRADTFPEMRGFGAVLLNPPTDFREQTTRYILVLPVPSELAKSLFGLDKSALASYVGEAMYKAMYRAPIAGTGVRVSLMGEAFIAFGYAGVAVLFCLMGALLSLLDALTRSSDDSKRYAAFTAAVMLAATIPYGFLLFYTGGAITITALLTARFGSTPQYGHSSGRGPLSADLCGDGASGQVEQLAQ